MLAGFSHIMLYVHDMPRAAKWYQDVLSFTVRYLAAPHYASLWNERFNFRIDLHPEQAAGNVGHGAMIYFVADDLDETIASLRARGVHVSDARRRGDSPRFTEFADSEGNTLGLYEQQAVKEGNSNEGV